MMPPFLGGEGEATRSANDRNCWLPRLAVAGVGICDGEAEVSRLKGLGYGRLLLLEIDRGVVLLKGDTVEREDDLETCPGRDTGSAVLATADHLGFVGLGEGLTGRVAVGG
jgi:hypothetical protein